MAGERLLPGLDLIFGFWTPGSVDYHIGLDTNMRILSALVQPRVLAQVAAVPATPLDGEVYLITAAPNANEIAIRDDGAWVYLAPQDGWVVYDLNTSTALRYDGTSWAAEASGGGGAALTVADEDTVISGAVTRINFEGASVVASEDTPGEIDVVVADTGSPPGLQTRVTGADVVVSDADLAGNQHLRMLSTADRTITVNDNLTNGEPLLVSNHSTGKVTFVAGPNVSFRSADGAVELRTSFSVATLIPVNPNIYMIAGDLA